MKKIAILGASGMLGQPVTRAFMQAGYEVTALVRDTDKAKNVFGPDIRFIQGDLNDMKSIEKLLKGQEALYLNLSVKPQSSVKQFQPEREGIDHILQLAPKSGLKRIAYLSSLVQFYQGQNGFNWWVFDIKKQAVEKIKLSGIPYFIFYASTFMESFGQGAYRKGDRIILAGESKFKMYLIAGADYGQQVVNAVERNAGNHEYVIQGQEGFTAEEAARQFADHYKKTKIRVIKMPFGILKFFGKLTNTFNYGANIIEALNHYPEKFEADKTWQDLGKPSTRFMDYISVQGDPE